MTKESSGQGSGRWKNGSSATTARAISDRAMVLARDRIVADTVTGARISTAKGLSSPPVRYSSPASRSEEHTSELQSLMRISYAVFCMTNNKNKKQDAHIMHL